MENEFVKPLGDDLYELSCPCPFFIFFVVEMCLPVGSIAQAKQELAVCSTECQFFSLYVDFSCEVVEVNQPFLDRIEKTEGKWLEEWGFSQSDWLLRIKKIG